MHYLNTKKFKQCEEGIERINGEGKYKRKIKFWQSVFYVEHSINMSNYFVPVTSMTEQSGYYSSHFIVKGTES